MTLLPVFVFVVIVLSSGALVQVFQWQVLATAQVPVPASSTPTATATATRLPPSATPRPMANAAHWFPGVVDPTATPTVTPTASPSSTPSATPSASATSVSEVISTSFTPGESSFLHNVTVALNANNGALRRVVVPPGETFSFVATLGPDPVSLPWRNVFVNLGAGPGESVVGHSAAEPVFYGMQLPIGTRVPAAPDVPVAPLPLQPTLSIVPPNNDNNENPDTPAPGPEWAAPIIVNPPPPSPTAPSPSATPEPAAPPPPLPVPVLGGGVCDLASRYVVVTRPLLPDEAYAFKLHPNGLQGIRDRDAVSIWFEGRPTDLDLRITNTTESWLLFTGDVEAGVVTITAALYDSPPADARTAEPGRTYLSMPKVDPTATPTPTGTR